MKEFFSLLWAKFSARRKGIVNPKPLFDWEKIEDMLRHSPVPTVAMLVLVWAVCSTLIIISMRRHTDISDWMIGQKAPQNIHARTDFSYVDTDATAHARQTAAAEAPEYFAIDKRKNENIIRRFNEFMLYCDTRLNDIKNKRIYKPKPDSAAAVAAGKISVELLENICREHLRGNNFLNFRDRLQRLLTHGIISVQDKGFRTVGRKVKIVDESGRIRIETNTIGEIPDCELAADVLADRLFPRENSRNNREFRNIAAELIGSAGNLSLDPERSKAAGERAAANVKEIIRSKNEGALLIHKGETFTASLRDMMLAEQSSLPKNFGMDIYYYNMTWSLILLLTAVFMASRLYPKIIKDARKTTIAGAVLIISLLINYWSINTFYYFLREGRVADRILICNALPVALCSVSLAVLLNFRVAVTAAFVTSAVTAMMVAPGHGFELTFRWFAVAAISGLAVRNVTNYRAYFLRIFFTSFLVAVVVNLDSFLLNGAHIKLITGSIIISACNAFTCAVLALVLIFAMELIFNIDTDMALMVLADYNHPLLERLKREAPGTMFHSMTVATLAEDAAKAIGANPLRAKVAGLFHDIGKLAIPHYFTENNRDSSSEHLKLNPQLSSIIIRDHVKEGLYLARQYRLFRWIRGAIITHHGDDLVHYFYARAKSQSSDAVVESQFRYNGQPPRAKELTIVSLADACEAASRSLDKPTAQKIQTLVDDIFIHRYNGGQLRNSELTLAELDIVKKTFVATLVSINHGRIAYTPENMNEKADQHLEK